MSALSVTFRDVLTRRLPALGLAFRVINRARARLILRGCEIGSDVMTQGRLVVSVQGRARIGERVVFIDGPVRTTLKVAPGAELDIGDGCHFNYGVYLEVTGSVRMGPRCMFGSYARIGDDTGSGARPVVLGADVWVAHGATIQPGVTIGDGAVISAGAVVCEDVPPGMLAMGNPARVMSQKLSQGP